MMLNYLKFNITSKLPLIEPLAVYVKEFEKTGDFDAEVPRLKSQDLESSSLPPTEHSPQAGCAYGGF